MHTRKLSPMLAWGLSGLLFAVAAMSMTIATSSARISWNEPVRIEQATPDQSATEAVAAKRAAAEEAAAAQAAEDAAAAQAAEDAAAEEAAADKAAADKAAADKAAADKAAAKAARPPVVSGSYIGKFVVTRDSSNQKRRQPSATFLGSHFIRTFVIGKGCTARGPSCSVNIRSLSLYDGPGRYTLRWTATVGRTRTAVISWKQRRIDTCVTPSAKVVGHFDTTIEASATFRDPRLNLDGFRQWTSATVKYTERAYSDDHDQGCYTSFYSATGRLHRR